eukprot:CAMPEP_0179059488 /NCGR_PEP_ID=MMETSP0796-20121207/25378_1 /TAXON_ID=73915 /ORGANISM="Pyrodinium bahamense, Strain pbaha01" /LENGTH=1004 /DNA_ID=CAMNT_0020756245 /DNA_START=1 /DNA_END=3015 /DNA_ORIENTATION=-
MRRGARGLAALALVGLAILRQASAVDRSKFRTCEQGSFCRRFKKWIQRPDREQALWSILPGTREELPGGGFGFKVQHAHEAAPHLLLRLNTYTSGMVRLRLTEIAPVHPRHEIPPGDVVTDPPPAEAAVKVEESPSATVFSFTSAAGTAIKAELKHSPLALDVTANGQLVQRLNARNFLNFERYRRPKEDLPPDSASPGVTVDAAAHPHDLDKNGMWEEEFGGHTDKKPRGPASLGMDMTFEGDVPSLFGLPEHMTKASLPFYEEPYRFFNLDVFEYENDEPMALYGAIPFLWAIHRFGSAPAVASAFIWINPSETFVKLQRDEGKSNGPAHAWWTSESGVIDAVVLVGPAPAHVSGQFHDLTGSAPLPPLWALGKHQCRWNYMSERDVATVDSSYDKYDIPYDVLWLDIEHTDGKAYFTWNPANFPTPEKMTESLSAKKRKLVNVVDPHIKKEDKFHVYTEVRDMGLFVKKVDWKMMDDPTDAKPDDWVEVEKIADPTAMPPDVWNEEEDGKWEPPKIDNPAYKGSWKARQITDPNSPISDFEGWCWPGTSLYPDFTDPKMREYWGTQFALDKYKGTNADTYIWNDMNEPSVFNHMEVTMPRDAIHPNGNVEHRDVHNMYGYYVHRATFEGLAKRTPGDRPFVLTRSFFIGSHRYTAIWTGDNYAKWDHLSTSIAMVGALTLAGQSLVGADVGGFFKHPDAEMVVRWYQLGALAYPFLRNHAHLETPRREPYVYDEQTMLRVKASLQLRYKMLPLWYTLFEEYHRKGYPVVRPLFWDFLDDPVTHTEPNAVEEEITMGGIVLVRGVGKPVSEGGDRVTVVLPHTAGWYDLHTGAFSAPGTYELSVTLDSIPAYYRAGTIIPLKSRMRRSSSCMWLDPLTLNVYLDPSTGTAKGRVYIDDYKTTAYQDGKSFLDVDLEFSAGVLKASAKRGELPAGLVSAEVERVEVFGLKKPPEGANMMSKGTRVELPPPISRQLGGGGGLYATVVKVAPWFDLQGEWALAVQ